MAQARVLVVDDERSMQEFLEIFLRSEGYHVATAGDVETAKLQLENDDFDVVITDIQMPGGSGLDLLRASHEISPETMVIMITAYASTETAIAAMKEDGTMEALGEEYFSCAFTITYDDIADPTEAEAEESEG